jgi:hypothetical protein
MGVYFFYVRETGAFDLAAVGLGIVRLGIVDRHWEVKVLGWERM